MRGCIETSGASISISDVFDARRIAFSLSDSEGNLPLPFPVLGSWTRLGGDEILD